MYIGFIVDLFMVIILFIPELRIIVFGENPQFHTPQYEWAMGLVGSCGLYITITLFWASLKPIERKDILLFIVFPLMLCAYTSSVYAFITKAVSIQFIILFTIITFAHCPYFFFIWLKAKKLEKINDFDKK